MADSPWSSVFKRAQAEAGLRGDRRLGTEHLLLGVLHDPALAATLGAGVEAARTALEALDRAALAAVGVDVSGLRWPRGAPARRGPTLTSVTSGARAALAQALGAVRMRDRSRLGPTALLVALMERERPDPVAELLDELGIDRAAARATLLQALGIRPRT